MSQSLLSKVSQFFVHAAPPTIPQPDFLSLRTMQLPWPPKRATGSLKCARYFMYFHVHVSSCFIMFLSQARPSQGSICHSCSPSLGVLGGCLFTVSKGAGSAAFLEDTADCVRTTQGHNILIRKAHLLAEDVAQVFLSQETQQHTTIQYHMDHTHTHMYTYIYIYTYILQHQSPCVFPTKFEFTAFYRSRR